jgi:hypothetical protein
MKITTVRMESQHLQMSEWSTTQTDPSHPPDLSISIDEKTNVSNDINQNNSTSLSAAAAENF